MRYLRDIEIRQGTKGKVHNPPKTNSPSSGSAVCLSPAEQKKQQNAELALY
jgi:hypothetical protein